MEDLNRIKQEIRETLRYERSGNVPVPVADLRIILAALERIPELEARIQDKNFERLEAAAEHVASSHECVNGYWRVEDAWMTRLRAALVEKRPS